MSSDDVTRTVTSGFYCSLSNVLSALSQESSFIPSTNSRGAKISSAGHGKLTQVNVAIN